MNPFIDENYYGNFTRGNNFNHLGGFNAGYHNIANPYALAGQMSPLKRLTGSFSLGKTLNMATKTINTANQIIPLVHQVTPLINNARNAIKVVKAVRSVNDFEDIDLDDIDKEVVVNEPNIIQDAEVIEDKSEKASSDYHEMFEYMI